MGVEQTELKQPNRFHFAAKLEKQERQWVIVVTSSSADLDCGSQEMSDESSALDALYKASTTLVGVNAKLSKEGVDEFAAVSHPLR